MSPSSKPLPPDPADCCGGGCARCVWDAYDDALACWHAANAGAALPSAPAEEAGN